MLGPFLVAAQRAFNSAFYTASVTVIPIFFITLAVELRRGALASHGAHGRALPVQEAPTL